MSSHAITLNTFGQHEAKQSTPNLGSVKGDHFATFTDLEGTAIRCLSGSLWVTLENDVMDHVLRVDQSLTIPVSGKVIIGGSGTYSLETGKRMSMAS
jgi:hypothetical protein